MGLLDMKEIKDILYTMYRGLPVLGIQIGMFALIFGLVVGIGYLLAYHTGITLSIIFIGTLLFGAYSHGEDARRFDE